MNRFEKAIYECMVPAEELLARTENPHHQAIAILAEFGIEADDEDAHYHYTTRQAFIWPYDERGRLAGEHLYVDSTTTLTERVDPSEVITPKQLGGDSPGPLARL